MTITATVIADSISPAGKRLTTLQLRYPRFIHAEELTHRVLCSQPELIEIVTPDGLMYDRNLSRNASSSRAVPVSRLIDDVLRDPVKPIFWGKNQPGMQAREELAEKERIRARQLWGYGRETAVYVAQELARIGAHKQIVNRLLEPFSHINVVVTATEWDNFFALRRHPDAQPEIKALADAMWEAMRASAPTLLKPDQWHLPYVDAQIEDDGEQSYRIHLTDPGDPIQGVRFVELEEARNISAARCARVSYLTHEGKQSTIEEDLTLCGRLLAGSHMSPFEHQAACDLLVPQVREDALWARQWYHGNFVGWIQNRKLVEAGIS